MTGCTLLPSHGWEAPKTFLISGFTPGGGHRPWFLTRPVALWLNEKLKFPDWTKKQLLALPETGINGMQVLGQNLPAVPRDDLHAIPEAVWTAEQELFIYETWVERAQAAVRAAAP